MTPEILNNLFSPPFPWLEYFGHWFILLAAFFEAMPFGFLVPGHALVMAGGFFAKLGVFSLAGVIMAAALGAVLGDLVSYLAGRRYGYDFLERYGRYFFFKREYFCRTRALVKEHAGKTIILGRFNFMTRSFAPFIAGASGVGFMRFSFYSLLGGSLWATLSVLIGYFFGQSFEIAVRLVGIYIAVAVLLSGLIIIALRWINKKAHVFTRRHLPILTVNVAALYIFAKIIDDVAKGKFIITIDRWLAESLGALADPGLSGAMVFVTDLFSPRSLALFSIPVFCFLILRKKIFTAAILLPALGGGYLLQHYFKQLLARPRPIDGLSFVEGFGFPSGHAAIAAIFFAFLIYAFKDDIRSATLRRLFIGAAAGAMLLTGLSRLYLGAHWLTDVAAGLCLGLFWLTFLIISFTLTSFAFKSWQESIKKKSITARARSLWRSCARLGK